MAPEDQAPTGQPGFDASKLKKVEANKPEGEAAKADANAQTPAEKAGEGDPAPAAPAAEAGDDGVAPAPANGDDTA